MHSHDEDRAPAAANSPAPTGFRAHLEFFDRDGDDRISLAETLSGLERIGLGHTISVPATVIIHLGVTGLGVVRGSFQNPLQLSISSVSVLRHPDTAIVDARPRFDARRLEDAFRRFGTQYAGNAITIPEIAKMASARLMTQTHGLTEKLLLPGGFLGTLVEWGALAWLAGERRDGQQVLTRDAALRFYSDPQFFFEVEDRLTRERRERRRTVPGKLRNLIQTWVL